MEVQAVNTAGAQVGDRVVISLESASLFKLSFLLYIFPILTLFAGALLGQMAAAYLHFDATTLSVVCAFLFFLLAFGLVRLGGNRLAKKDAYRPKVVRILKQNI
jgi:sigma-E factor negative regulatory protein RseC